jgi:predicted PurR-regulated permease PerM
MNTNTQKPFEHGFMLSLLLLAIGGLIWLFTPFISALFLSLMIAIATFSRYEQLQNKFSSSNSALLTTLLVTIVLILPLGYILLISTLEISTLIQTINHDFNFDQITQIFNQTVAKLPLSDAIKTTLSSALNNNLETLLIGVKDFSIVILKSIVSLSSHFVLFLIIVIFTLYYFYIDGKKIVKHIKSLSPLEAHLNDILLNQFKNLSITLVASIFLIALLQGMIFSITVMIIGLPALYFGIAIALASFVPLLGGLIIWLPLSLYLYAQGQTTDALIVAFSGAVVIGFVVDNLVRPNIIKLLSKKSSGANTLDHTLITVLSTLAGIIQFGILGLFIGPIIAAMAISIFDIYNIKYNK